jgi:hypothetical protein
MSDTELRELEEIVKKAVMTHDFYPNAAAKAILAAGYSRRTDVRTRPDAYALALDAIATNLWRNISRRAEAKRQK